MIPFKLLNFRFKESLICYFLRIAIAASIVWVTGSSYQPVWAETENAIVIDMPISGQSVSNDLITQAELLAANTISQQFSQNPSLSEIKVVVTGNRYGEIIPVLTTSVSRTQWQTTPQVDVWTQYYSASYTLFQRHDLQENARIASAPASTSTTNVLASVFQIDQAYDEGRLSGVEAQKYLDYL